VAVAIALATIVSLIGCYVRAPDAVLGVAFARARAAEAAVTQESQPRLRIEREDVPRHDVDAIPVSRVVTKTVGAHYREREAGAPVRLVALALRAHDVPPADVPGVAGIDELPTDPPTRARARLMVFLN
jgi:hypothetical protein